MNTIDGQIKYYRRNLPHYHPANATFFVTLRLAGSLPSEAIARLRAERIQDEEFLLKMAEKVAKTMYTGVAIYGESGTGKEVLARAIHHASGKNDGSFVTVNCAAILAALLESELFRHKKGSFTVADSDRMGKLDLAPLNC